MGKDLPKEKVILLAEMTDLIAQAEVFYEEEDYGLLPEILSRIAEIARNLDDFELAEDFSRRAKEVHSILLAKDAPAEPEILLDEHSKPPIAPKKISESITPIPLIQSASKKIDASMNKRLQKIRTLSDLILTKQTAN